MDKGVNLFFEILKDEQESNTKDEPFAIGKIISSSPLIIRIEELDLYEKDLKVNPHLREWKEYVTGLTTVNGYHPHDHGLIYIIHPSKLVIGRYVACYGIEYSEKSGCYQKYCALEVLE